MQNLRLSIIIPIYNVEKYLERCVNSILNQNISTKLYEIILVNDGSTDNSLAIAEKIKLANENIVLISKENGGLSSARNSGLAVAKGEYIWFVDSDDWITNDCLEKLIGLLNNKVDLLAFNAIISKSDESDVLCKRNTQLKIDQFITGYDIFKYGFTYPYSGVPFYIFNRNFLFDNNLQFENGIIYEDILFTPMALSLANNCRYLDQGIYHYFHNSNSITNTNVKFKNLTDILTVADKLDAFGVENKLKEQQKWIINKTISLIIGKSFRMIPLLEERHKAVYDFSQRSFWLRSIFKSQSYKHLILYWCIKWNIITTFTFFRK